MQFPRQILAANNHIRVSVNCHCVLYVNMVLEFHNEKFLSFDLHDVWKNCQTVALNILCLTVFALMLIEASGHLAFLPANHKDTWQLLSFCGHKRQIMQHVRNKSELAFAITSTQTKNVSASMWNWTHVPSHAKVTATRKGQTTVRAQIRQSTCRPATVCIWKCLHMTFSLCVTAKVRVCVTTVKWACPPQREKMRENLENKKRGRRQRCCKMPSVQMWVWKDTHIGTWLEIHTQQVDTKPHTYNFHFCLVWQHSWNTKVRVHVQVMAHI